jgi:uncharacterized membrane protein YdbT with pleckstrin-like domain
MGYLEKNLLPGEKLIYRTRLHWIVLDRPAILGVFGLVFVVLAATGENAGVLACIGAPLVLLALLQLAYVLIAFQNWEYVVTNKRVLIKTGILRHKSLELLLGKVEGIGVNEPLLGRLLGYGTIVVTGTGGTKEPFRWINNPTEFRRRVHDQIQGVVPQA